MALFDDAKGSLHIATDYYDDEIRALVGAAVGDMRRVGIRDELLDPVTPDPLVRHAVCTYTKANLGYDNPEADRFMQSYRETVVSLLNSDANSYLWGKQ